MRHRKRAGALGLVVWCLGAAFGPAMAQSAGDDRLSQFSQQTALMDRRLSSQYAHSARLAPETPGLRDLSPREAIPRYTGSIRSRFLPEARLAARRHGVPEDLFLRLIRQESGWNPNARSHKGAMGLAQLMPGTARLLGVNPLNPRENLEGGARYLAQQYRKFGSWRLALAAYNAGPGAVERHGGVPPFRETRDYVRIILEQG